MATFTGGDKRQAASYLQSFFAGGNPQMPTGWAGTQSGSGAFGTGQNAFSGGDSGSNFFTNNPGAFGGSKATQEGVTGFLEFNPEATFNAFLPGGRSRGQNRFYQNSFQDIHRQYLGELAGQMASGQSPTMNFPGFARDFDYQGYAASFSPWARGEENRRYNPSARWLTSF